MCFFTNIYPKELVVGENKQNKLCVQSWTVDTSATRNRVEPLFWSA